MRQTGRPLATVGNLMALVVCGLLPHCSGDPAAVSASAAPEGGSVAAHADTAEGTATDMRRGAEAGSEAVTPTAASMAMPGDATPEQPVDGMPRESEAPAASSQADPANPADPAESAGPPDTRGAPPDEPTDAAVPPAADPEQPDGAAPMLADEDATRTSQEIVTRMAPGWNLGNSLDSCSMVASDKVDETTWGNPKIEEALFLALKDEGMRSIRIPVTWRHHLGPAPDFTIDPTFMERVVEVVGYAVDNGLYAIINLHHDGGGDPEGGAWVHNASTDYEGTLAKFRAVWAQIATRFADHPHRLLFEGLNEVGFDDLDKAQGYATLNKLNQAFVDLVRGSTGNNPTRHLLFAGYWTDFAESSMGTQVPNDPVERSILSVHYYTPWMFCVTADVKTWGSAADLQELRDKFQLVQRAFIDKGTPVILGEYGVNSTAERSSRLFWLEYVTKSAFDLGIAPMFWDNGEELDRTTYRFRTEGIMDAFKRATSGMDYEIVKLP